MIIFHSILHFLPLFTKFVEYVMKNSGKRSLFRWNTCPQTLRQISVTDKDMYLCKRQCSTYEFYDNFQSNGSIHISLPLLVDLIHEECVKNWWFNAKIAFINTLENYLILLINCKQLLRHFAQYVLRLFAQFYSSCRL